MGTHREFKPPEEFRLTGDIIALHGSQRPEKTAVIFGNEQISYGDYDRRANQFANGFLELEPSRDAKVAIMCRNCIPYPIIHYGMARTGRTLVHMSSHYTPSELRHVLEQSGAAYFICDANGYGVFQQVRADLASPPVPIGVGPGIPQGILTYESLLEGRPETDPGIEMSGDDPFCILYTSGTTGNPKGAIASHRARLTSAVAGVEDFPLYEDDIAAVTIPLCHAAGLYSWYQPNVIAGTTAVIMLKWDAGDFIAAAEKHAITSAFVVPAQLNMLLEHPDFNADRLKSLRMIAFGGAPATPELIARAERLLPHVDIVLAFGSTETGHLICLQPAERRAHPGTLGKPGHRIEMKIFKEPGVEAGTGEVGEICTKGRHLLQGYLNEPEQTAEYFKSGDGWGWTGDQGSRDENGLITLAGRSKEMIISGGMNIYPAEIENALADHPDIVDCACFGVPDKTWGELPACAVIKRPDTALSEHDVMDYSATKVARYKRLRSVVFVDTLPRTLSGKVQRHILKETYGGEAASGN